MQQNKCNYRKWKGIIKYGAKNSTLNYYENNKIRSKILPQNGDMKRYFGLFIFGLMGSKCALNQKRLSIECSYTKKLNLFHLWVLINKDPQIILILPLLSKI